MWVRVKDVELDPRIQKQYERIVANSDAGDKFRRETEHNIIRLARFLNEAKWADYHGEETAEYLFGRTFTEDAWVLEPSPCCCCGHVIGGQSNEYGHGFWPEGQEPMRYICIPCYRRWHTDPPEAA